MRCKRAGHWAAVWTAGFCCLGLLAPLQAQVKLGIDNLEKRLFAGLEGKRVGLVTNPSGVNAQGVATAKILYNSPRVNLVALFGPEHGVYGTVKAGVYVESHRDRETGLMVHSLYGPTRKPTPGMLKGIDILIFDIQDIGSRSYTFISTLGMVMEAAAESGVEVWVMDRPNPLGGQRIEGAGIEPGLKSFVGQYNIPYLHGLTVGELARWINRNYLAKPCRLNVYKMSGWTRDMSWQDTGLKWVPTSPNIPDAASVAGYAATGLLGEAGVDNGANMRLPFELVVMENLDKERFCARFNALGLKGVTAEPYAFKAGEGKYRNILYSGARLRIDPHQAECLLALNYYALDLLRELMPTKKFLRNLPSDKLLMFDKLNGIRSNRARWMQGTKAAELRQSWRVFEDKWRAERAPYLLY